MNYKLNIYIIFIKLINIKNLNIVSTAILGPNHYHRLLINYSFS